MFCTKKIDQEAIITDKPIGCAKFTAAIYNKKAKFHNLASLNLYLNLIL